MARSAKRPRKAAPRRNRLFHDGALALGGAVSRNPMLVGGSTAFLVTLFYVSANALWYQPFPHSNAFFATRTVHYMPVVLPREPETTINIVRPAMSIVAKGDPVVEQVQAILTNLGFYSGAIDGIAGPNTRSAIASYQQRIGLDASGAINGDLLDQLGATPTTASIVPTPTLRKDETNSIIADNNDVAVMSGSDALVLKIQAGLKAFGNEDMQLDGVLGARTKSALREFQAIFRLPETGEPDQAVYAKMREIGLTD